MILEKDSELYPSARGLKAKGRQLLLTSKRDLLTFMLTNVHRIFEILEQKGRFLLQILKQILG